MPAADKISVLQQRTAWADTRGGIGGTAQLGFQIFHFSRFADKEHSAGACHFSKWAGCVLAQTARLQIACLKIGKVEEK